MTARVALLSTDPSGEASTSCRVNRGFASAATPADYRIYVRSRWLSPEAAAALFAAAHAPARKLAGRLAIRSN